MARTSRKTSTSHARVARQTLELSLAAPQVVAQRVARMAAAGAGGTLSARDRREFSRMGAEKLEAFQESWMAMGVQLWRTQLTFAQAWTNGMARLWLSGAPLGRWPAVVTLPWAQASAQMAGAALAPVHGRAVSNARRLRR